MKNISSSPIAEIISLVTIYTMENCLMESSLMKGRNSTKTTYSVSISDIIPEIGEKKLNERIKLKVPLPDNNVEITIMIKTFIVINLPGTILLVLFIPIDIGSSAVIKLRKIIIAVIKREPSAIGPPNILPPTMLSAEKGSRVNSKTIPIIIGIEYL